MNEVEITPESGISAAEVDEAIAYLLAKKAKQASVDAISKVESVFEQANVIAKEIDDNPEYDSDGVKVDTSNMKTALKAALSAELECKGEKNEKTDSPSKTAKANQVLVEEKLVNWLKAKSEVGPFHHEPTDKGYWLVRIRRVSGDHLRIQVLREGLGLYGDHHENNITSEMEIAKWLDKNENHPKYGKFRSLYSGSAAYYLPALLVINGNGHWVIRVAGSSEDGNREYGMSFSVDEQTVAWFKKTTKIGKGK